MSLLSQQSLRHHKVMEQFWQIQVSQQKDWARDIPAYAMRRSGVLPQDTSSLKSLSNAAMSCQLSFWNLMSNEHSTQFVIHKLIYEKCVDLSIDCTMCWTSLCCVVWESCIMEWFPSEEHVQPGGKVTTLRHRAESPFEGHIGHFLC